MRIRRKLVEAISKETSEHEIKLIAGIEPNPPDPYSNAIFYVRMESIDKETNKKSKVESIWLSLNEMAKLSVLMTIASRFWLERLEKGSGHSQKRITAFVDAWNQVKDAMDNLFEGFC